MDSIEQPENGTEDNRNNRRKSMRSPGITGGDKLLHVRQKARTGKAGAGKRDKEEEQTENNHHLHHSTFLRADTASFILLLNAVPLPNKNEVGKSARQQQQEKERQHEEKQE